mgnify:CR=1 FL=1
MNLNLQVLISTMHQKDYSLLKRMNIDSDAVVINQCDEDFFYNLNIDNHRIMWINSKERGLSRSRNMALINANADICLLADDDLEYVSDYRKIIINQFELNPDADIIAFQVEGIEERFKKYTNKPRKISFLTSMKISSVEIAFRLDKIKKADLKFNVLFGAGSKYYMGEENIFLSDCLRKGLNIVPIKIAYVHIGESTWFNGYDEDYFINRGAVFTAMSYKLSIPLIVQFAVRKVQLYKNRFNIFQVINYMLEGRKRYLADINSQRSF